MADPRAGGGEIHIIDRMIAGVPRPSHEAMAVIPTTGGVCTLWARRNLFRGSTYGTMLVAHSTSSLANRAGIVVVVVVVSPDSLRTREESPPMRDAPNTTVFPSGPLLPLRLLSLVNCRSCFETYVRLIFKLCERTCSFVAKYSVFCFSCI